MEPKLIEWGPTLLAGFSFYGDPFAESAGWTEENEIGRLWQRYFDYLAAQGQQQLDQVVNQQVAYEVRLRLDQLAPGGGLLLGPSQAITDDCPVENVVTMYETARRYGEY